MSEKLEWLQIPIIVALAAFVFCFIVYKTAEGNESRRQAVLAAVKAGANPLEAACAFNMGSEMCYVAWKRETK